MPKFKGYYFRHQNNDKTIAFIVGKSLEKVFIQVITDTWSRFFYFPDISFGKQIKVGNNVFSSEGITIDLPDIKGEIKYSDLTPLKSDIMGIFKFFPMECRHTIVSMRHNLSGSLTIDGETLCFDGGIGYLEGDSGTSFPKEYLWLHANDFPDGQSFTLSVAKIPFACFSFQGVICVVMVNGKEYRLATYLGAKAKLTENTFTVKQKNLTLEGEILSQGEGFSLSSPQNGKMLGMIKEHNNATFTFTLRDKEKTICSLSSTRAAYERHNEKSNK